MRIGIDVRRLHDFGIGTYIRNLLRHLSRMDGETEFVLLCRPPDQQALASVGANFRSVPETAPNYSVSERVRVPWALAREGVTLFHAPHYVLPPLVRCRSVVTIHDCIHLMFPQYLPSRLALTYARTSIGAASRRANRVLTVSESSKRDILRFVDVPADKIDVIYNAYDERFGVEPREEDVVRVRERFQLHDEFVLYAGNVKPHKNLARLIDAFNLVRQRGLDHLKLVMIGDEISKYTALRRAVHHHQLHKYVRFLGYLPQETLAVMYRLAGVFVFPSLYEGFGLPPLEAMASGTPVVTSNLSSLPEVAGNRTPPDSYVARPASSRDSPLLPPVPAALSRARRAVRSRRVRSRDQQQPLRGEVRHRPAARRAHLLLPYADALRVGSIRRVLRRRSRRAAALSDRAAGDGAPGTVGPRDGGPREPVPHELAACCATDRAVL